MCSSKEDIQRDVVFSRMNYAKNLSSVFSYFDFKGEAKNYSAIPVILLARSRMFGYVSFSCRCLWIQVSPCGWSYIILIDSILILAP